MNAQGVARCFVQGQAEIIEVHHLTEPACQLMEQRGQVAVRDDRFRNGQQSAVPVIDGRCLSFQVRACHGETPDQSFVPDQQVVHRTTGGSRSPA
jgi:hypothetical protein